MVIKPQILSPKRYKDHPRHFNITSLPIIPCQSENTADQKARNMLHILWYAMGSIPLSLQSLLTRGSIEQPRTSQNFHTEKITVNN